MRVSFSFGRTPRRHLVGILVALVACASARKQPDGPPVDAPLADIAPPQGIDAVAAALSEPGCPGLYAMYGPEIQGALSEEQNAQLCEELLHTVGPIVDVSPPRYEGPWAIYRLTATKDELILRLVWADDGRIAQIRSSSDASDKCQDSIARHGPPPRPTEPPPRSSGPFTDVSAHALPPCVTAGRSMDAHPGDIDGDGDLDLVVAVEFGPNIVLINDGHGRFEDESRARLDDRVHDSEDIGLADLDGDGDLDLVFVSEDDRLDQLYLNDGTGVFADASERLGSVDGVSNAVELGDIDGDGYIDILIGNAGLNTVLINDGKGTFSVETDRRLPSTAKTTQDLELGDIDGDGDLDLIVANEDGNRLLLNDGKGVFRDETDARLPSGPEQETREADFGDVDGDGDLDLVLANVEFIEGKDPQNRLLFNDGHGVFEDRTATHLPVDPVGTLDGDLIDIDGDGDLDLVTANWQEDARAFLNDGKGSFRRDEGIVVTSAPVSGVDFEFADFTGDGVPDLYLCNYRGLDHLLVANGPE